MDKAFTKTQQAALIDALKQIQKKEARKNRKVAAFIGNPQFTLARILEKTKS